MSYQTVAEMLESPEFQARMEATVQAFPEKRTALMLALHQCQSELRFVPLEFQSFIAEKLGMAPAHVRGVVTFYEMFTEKQLGQHLLQVCKTLPCMLAGSEVLLEHLQGKLGIRPGQTTQEGALSRLRRSDDRGAFETPGARRPCDELDAVRPSDRCVDPRRGTPR